MCAVTGTVVTFVLVLMITPGIRALRRRDEPSAVEVVGWAVIAAQFVLSCVIGTTYLSYHRRGRPPATEWSGTSRFGLLSLAFVLGSTLLCQLAGTLSPCDQMPWPVVAAAVAIYGLLTGYASIVIGSPWLGARRS